MTSTDDELLLSQIFHPFAFDKIKEVREKNSRFVHYTDANAALSIIENKEIWMRNATCMNDYLEIDYGLECLAAAYKSDGADVFKRALDALQPDICEEIVKLFDGWSPLFARQTYLTCLSAHRDDEDQYGRLSMWRAYGGVARVALVLNNTPFLSESDALALRAGVKQGRGEIVARQTPVR